MMVRIGNKKELFQKGFTLVETLIACAIFGLVLVGATSVYSLFSRQLPGLSQEVSLHHSLRLADALLVNRIARGSEIISPDPVKTSEELVFRDVDNEWIKLRLHQGCLRSFRENGAPEISLNKKGVRPINLRDVDAVEFTVTSPASVMIKIKFGREKDRDSGMGIEMNDFSGSVFFVRLKNARAVKY
ncbi:MAG: prepilin-type N-terminal cleavage/methylation domain-containing protein [Candidatus Riflebacteria bacterium]